MRKALSEPAITAILTLSIGADGALQMDAVGIEPEHANAMLNELDALRDQLQTFLDDARGEAAPVIPFKT